jgi:3-deoxy-D-manno-octulosonic-acid transferase
VGEVRVLEPLVDQLKRRLSDTEFVISTTSQTGYALARARFPDELVTYAPLDFSWAVAAALRRLRPNLLVLVELELWPNLVRAARRRSIPVALVNGRMSRRSLRGYRWVRFLIKPLLTRLDLVAVQNELYARRFRQLGAPAERTHVVGSIKCDGVCCERDNAATTALARLAAISAADVVFLAGSTQAPEEALALDTFQRLAEAFPQLRLVIVPRHPDRFAQVAAMLDRRRVSWSRRSELERTAADAPARVLLVDTIGELAAWWGTAQIAYVGGSMGSRGGQNMIEPAAYGAALAFGPHTENFQDVSDALLEHSAALVVRNAEELTAFVLRCLADPTYATTLGIKARSVIASLAGATARTVELLLNAANQQSAETRTADGRRPFHAPLAKGLENRVA